jgi:hypothetical protein
MMEDIWSIFGRLALLALVIFIPTCTYRSCFSDAAVQERMAEQKKQQEQDAADRIPRVIREVDGCKVYAFKEHHWHFFTRCPTTTTTDRTYEECRQSGKTRRCENKTEQIVTGNI